MADTGHKRPVEILTEDEVRQIMAQCSRRAPTGIRDRALLAVMYRCGLRVSEALDLRPVDVDPDHGDIRILHGKGDKARTVAADDATIALIQLWRAHRKQLGINGNKTLFCTLDGGPLSREQVGQMLKRRAVRAGIEKRVHPHGLRHSCAAELAREGVPINEIQAILGHVHASTTSIYINHIAPTQVIARMRARTWDPDA